MTIIDKIKDKARKNLASLNQTNSIKIQSIYFPIFKNFHPDTCIEFESPITVLVGKNGTSKSSVLKALLGCVYGKSIEDYWFSSEFNFISDKTRFWYTYEYKEMTAQALLRRSQGKIKNGLTNPDYWETAKSQKSLGMRYSPDEVKDLINAYRWPKIKMPFMYINCRFEDSAFERIILDKIEVPSASGRSKASRLETRQWLRDKSKKITKMIKNKEDGVKVFSKDELDLAGYILDQSYDEIKYLDHEEFIESSRTFIVRTKNKIYGDSLAGSGEMMVMLIISKLYNQQQGSLVILDEPEISLHPSAQSRLMEYIIYAALKDKHQIVISSHSPNIIEHLSDTSIRLFYRIDDEIFSRRSSSIEAFNQIGATFNKPTIIVEDILAQKIIEHVASCYGDDFKNSFEITHSIDGTSEIWKTHVPRFISTKKSVYIIMDGDQEPSCKIKKSKSLAPDDMDEYIQNFTKTPNRYSNTSEKSEIIDYIYKHLGFLPCKTPEQFIVENSDDSNLEVIKASCNKEQSGFYKEVLKKLSEEENKLLCGENITSGEILTTQCRLLQKISKDHPELLKIKEMLDSIIEGESLR